MPDTPDAAPTLSHEQETSLRGAILAAIGETPGYYAGPVMGPLVKHLSPVVAQMLEGQRAPAPEATEHGGRPVGGVLGSLGLDMEPVAGGGEFDFSSLPGADALGPEFVADFKEMVEGIFGGFTADGMARSPIFQDIAGQGPYPVPVAPPYEKPADLVGGPGTTEPFAIILTDPGDWPYNNAFVCDDAAALHRIENDRATPKDELLGDITDGADDGTYSVRQVGNGGAQSEGAWWASVNKALDEAGIAEDRRFEGIYY